jgi:Uma2 family endonuclease
VEAEKLPKLTIEEYLSIEIESGQKHEFHDGSIFAMAGRTIEHGLVAGNIYGELKFGLRQGARAACTVLNSEIKLHIVSINKILYPDAMVICGEIKKSAKEPNAVTNPSIIVEVLSRSTESYDRGDKFFFYRQIPSLETYILIDQYEPKVEIFSKKQNMWEIDRIIGKNEIIPKEIFGVEIALSAIYEGVF